VRREVILLWLLFTVALVWVACSANTTVVSPSPTLPSTSLPPSPRTTAIATTVSGIVRDQNGPVKGATVRVPSVNRAAISAADGSFTLTGLADGQPINLSAWAPGYFVAGKNNVLPGQTGIVLELATHPTEDDPNYQWISAFKDPQQPLTCQHCMACSSCNAAESTFPFDEWQRDAHSRSATNPRFLSMYNGTDLSGNASPLTRYAFHRDYGRVPLRPDPSEPYYGPGFKLDFPDSAGNCASCHLPAAAVNAAYQTDPNSVAGVGREGVTCDLCHKVWDVRLDAATGLPFPNMPGVLSYEFKRPGEGKQIFIGPYDDVPGRSVYSPLQNRSEFCAPCHFGVFWNVTIYNSFGEWLASPYADPKTGKTCQDCHMPHVGATRFAQPPPDSPRIAYDRDPQTIFSHLMPGAADTALLQNAVTLKAAVRREGDNLSVEVSIVNDKTGHHIPTDSPLRNMLLVVRATDANGKPLPLLEGPTLPEWADDYAGQPGRGYAKILEELWTEVSPTGAYWNPTRVLSDTRLAAFAKDESRYTFAAPSNGQTRVEARLIFRHAFKALARLKGWELKDVVMANQGVVLD
jgi:hypothetical protein